jgi:hypothetical protein
MNFKQRRPQQSPSIQRTTKLSGPAGKEVAKRKYKRKNTLTLLYFSKNLPQKTLQKSKTENSLSQS